MTGWEYVLGRHHHTRRWNEHRHFRRFCSICHHLWRNCSECHYFSGTAASVTTPWGSAASAATSGDITVDVATSGSSVVVYAAQMQHKAIPIMGSASDRGISSGTGGLTWVDLGIPAARADTSGASLTLDTRQGVRRTDLKSLGVIDSGSSAETWRGSGWRAETWRDSGWRAETWRDSGWRAETWRDSGWRAETWRDSGWRAETWRDSGSHRPRPKHFTLRLDSRLPHRQTSSGEGRPVHLKLHHPERRSPAGLRSESPALLSLHTRLRVLSQLHIYYQICWWYCGSGPHFQQWWDRILGWGRETNIMVPGQLSLSECEQN